MAFGEHSICQVSQDPAYGIDINETLFYVTARNFSYFVHSNILAAPQSSTVDLAGFEYIPLGDSRSFIFDFILKSKVDFSLTVANTIRLDFSTLWIRAKEVNNIKLVLLLIPKRR